jgi:hypothetical protein
MPLGKKRNLSLEDNHGSALVIDEGTGDTSSQLTLVDGDGYVTVTQKSKKTRKKPVGVSEGGDGSTVLTNSATPSTPSSVEIISSGASTDICQRVKCPGPKDSPFLKCEICSKAYHLICCNFPTKLSLDKQRVAAAVAECIGWVCSVCKVVNKSLLDQLAADHAKLAADVL